MLTADRFVRSGKVRDLYRLDDDRLLLVASDRLSAFDVVLPTAIPDKGRVLTGLSRFWFAETGAIVPNHLVGTSVDGLPEIAGLAAGDLRGRVMLCRAARVLPIEIVVRGYLSGSGWKEYQASRAVCGVPLPAGLRESDRLPEPILTPATKAPLGEHDINIDFESVVSSWPTGRRTATTGWVRTRPVRSRSASATWPSACTRRARRAVRRPGSSWPTRSSRWASPMASSSSSTKS
jgi:Phosphoribosylaminoimidazolesuccinocarboxamide (SAICAR) synthase